VTSAELEQRLGHVRESTDRLVTSLAELALTAETLRGPSLLPGWSRAHVLSHLARNADAIWRMVDGAARGESAEMYPGGQAVRDADIEAGAQHSPAELLADVRASAERLDQAWSKLPDEGWDIEGITRTGRSTIRRMVASRWREVEIHAVDLDLGYLPASWPAAFVAPLLPSLADPERLAPRLPDGVAVEMEATDSGHTWLAGSGDPVLVRGPSWALTAWLLGRPGAVRAVLGTPPQLSPWL
jgi:maleylpyruvate isomerase